MELISLGQGLFLKIFSQLYNPLSFFIYNCLNLMKPLSPLLSNLQFNLGYWFQFPILIY